MAIDSYKSKQIAHERMGWRSRKYLGSSSWDLASRADDFTEKGWLEKQCFGDVRKIPYYRLTSKGREAFMAKGSRFKWVPDCFVSEHQHSLDRSRLNLNNKGWFSSKDVTVDEKLIHDGYVEERKMQRGYRDLNYYRITEKGRSFLRKALPVVFTKRYHNDINELAKTYRKDLATALTSMKARTKEALLAMDLNDFNRYGISGNISKFKTSK